MADLMPLVKEWEAALDAYQAKVIDAAKLTDEIPVIDASTFLADCPPEVRRLMSARARARSLDGREVALREAHEKARRAKAAEGTADLLVTKGKDADARAQYARAKALREESERIIREVLS